MTVIERVPALAPFRVRSFRFQWPADLCTSWAGEMEGIILSWYIIVETGSVLFLTIYGSLQYAGTLLSPLFGVLGDRIGRLASGYDADIIALDGDPISDISAVRRVVFVMRGGIVYKWGGSRPQSP